MDFTIENPSRALSIIKVNLKLHEPFYLQVLADAHWDNPYCRRDLLESHMARTAELGGAFVSIGDWFCAMQGSKDRRGSKSKVRPEHNNDRYFDSLVETSAEWLRPYKDRIACWGDGNHETAILRHHETDLGKRLLAHLGIPERRGGYGGYVGVRFYIDGKCRGTHLIKYFHGSGGGGPVTKGVIQAQRKQTRYACAHTVVTGHVHEEWGVSHMSERVCLRSGRVTAYKTKHLCVPTYKDEHHDGTSGFQVERDNALKPVGGLRLKFTVSSSSRNAPGTNYRIRRQTEELEDIGD